MIERRYFFLRRLAARSRRLRVAWLLGWGAAILATGCVSHALENQKPTPCCGGGTSYPQSADRAVDLLFVIDDSGSMGYEQDLLRAQFTALMGELRRLRGGLPDLHLGVISTDLGAGGEDLTYCEEPGGDGGRLLTGSCVNPSGAAYLVDVAPAGCAATRDSTGWCAASDCAPAHCAHEPSTTLVTDTATGCPRCRNYAGQELEDVFSCVAGLGTLGCGFEQPLEAMHRALDGSNAENEGFLRENAVLGVVLLTDEDDCSASDPGLFTRDSTTLDSSVGPLTSFRCFEFGVTCDVNDRTAIGPRTGCVPREDPEALLHPVSRYVELLRGLKDDQMLVVAAIAGPVPPSPTGIGAEVTVGRDELDQPEVQHTCGPYGAGIAMPGIRLRALVDAFNSEEDLAWAYTESCSPTFTDALRGIGRRVRDLLESPCLPSPLQGCSDPGAELGAPKDDFAGNDVCLAKCLVQDVFQRGTASETKKTVLPCLEVCPEGHCRGNTDRALAYAGGHPPLRDPGLPVSACWQVGYQEACPGSNFAELLIARQADPPPRSFAEVACVTISQTEQLCNDAQDNDEDGLVDLDDPDCR